MSTEAALEKLAAKDQTTVPKLEEETVQTEEQTMPEEEPSLAEDGDIADNDESTVDSKEQERRERRRAKQKERKMREREEQDDDTYFSASNETNKKEDGFVTKAIDKFVDLLNPVEKGFDGEEEDTLVSEATDNKTPIISKEQKPSVMQQLDKHVLTRFGCSSNPAYIPEDEAVETPIGSAEAKPAEERNVPDSDVSAYGANSILRVDEDTGSDQDPGDPDIQLQSLDEEVSSDSSTEQPQGARAFFCGAMPLKGARPLKGEKGDDNSLSEEQSKGIIYSPSQLEEMPFDQQPKTAGSETEATTDETALGGAKKAFGAFTENMAPMIASISQTVRTKVFLEDVGDDALSRAGDDLHMTEKSTPPETAEPSTQVEGETMFEEAAVEGHEVPANDDEPSEEGEEVPAGPESFERDETEMPFDEAKSKDEEDDAGAEVEEEEETTQLEEALQKEEPEETPKEEIKVPTPPPKEAIKPATRSTSAKSKSATTKQPKDKKKKKSLFGRIFKKKSKKTETPKESILLEDEKKDVSPSEQLIIPDEPPEKETRPPAPVDPTITNKAKRESWKNAKRQASAKKELDAAIPKSDSTEDFDLLVTSSKNTANDDWDKLANPMTPDRKKGPESASSPSGVAEFSEMAEL